jgi:hypothetical protein
MPLTLPNLDDRSYADLVAEARALIPALAPDWTDHNPADPGITLVDLFAWLTEMLLYRLNQVTDENRLAFLRLINGPDRPHPNTKSLAQNIRDTVLALREPARAVTAGDFEKLARDVPGVARACCVPRRNLEPADLDIGQIAARPSLGDAAMLEGRNILYGGDRAWQIRVKATLTAQWEGLNRLYGHGGDRTWQIRAACAADMPADISVVVVSKDGATSPLRAVRAALEPARLLTTRVHVVAARRVAIAVDLSVPDLEGVTWRRQARGREEAPRLPLTLTLTIRRRDDMPGERLLAAAEEALRRFLDPYEGGSDGQGWPFGRAVYLSEIYDRLARLPGADYVTPTGRGPVVADPAVAWRVRDNAANEFAAIALDPDELPEARISTAMVTAISTAPETARTRSPLA